MSGVHFIQHCPTCARRVQVPLEMMGKKISCQHCQGHFLAGFDDPSPNDVLHRAEELLEDVELMRMEKPVQDAW